MPQLRPARATDRAAIEQLLTAVQLPTVGVGAALDSFIVADDGGQLVGVAGLELCGANALLRSVAVVTEWRGKGLGAALVHRVVDAADSRRLPLYLLTTTADGYFPAFGFSVIPRDAAPADIRASDEFQRTCPASATVMARARVPAT